MSHLLLALLSSLQEGNAHEESITSCDTLLEAFGLITRELGRTISFLVQALFQVWLCQSGLTEASRRTRQALPVEPGAFFGPCAEEQTIQAGQTRQQLLSMCHLSTWKTLIFMSPLPGSTASSCGLPTVAATGNSG